MAGLPEHDPEKWEPVFGQKKKKKKCAEAVTLRHWTLTCALQQKRAQLQFHSFQPRVAVLAS